jgi:hypothetical protein
MKKDLSSPPVTDVDWVAKRRDGRPLFSEVVTNGVRTRVDVKVRRYRGPRAFEVWRQHLARFGAFCEFEILQVGER